jgi:phenylalanyl-tRNA synthetase alpha chain
MSILEKIETLKQQASEHIIDQQEKVEEFRLKFLSKKGELNELFEEFKKVSGEEKKELGKQLNILRQQIESLYNDAISSTENFR